MDIVQVKRQKLELFAKAWLNSLDNTLTKKKNPSRIIYLNYDFICINKRQGSRIKCVCICKSLWITK